MNHFAVSFLLVLLVLLIILSAFFSAAETALMSINRYRLRHKARMKKRSAILILRLLKRPDRLLGMILIGNNFCNILASAIATLLAIDFLGDKGIALSTILLTFLILIFAEVAPKTLAALYPEKIAKGVAWPVFVLLKLFYPLVWLINAFANSLLRLLRVNVSSQTVEPLSREELRSIVFETTGKTTRQYQSMLLGILDLNKVTVDDVMIPRHEIAGIDVEQSWDLIQRQLIDHPHDWLPVYRSDINQVIGVLHLRELMQLTLTQTLDKEKIIQLLEEPYFIPEGTPLNIQLGNFQRQHKRSAFVVDEYGEILGLLTLKDILEEIVGEFTSNVDVSTKMIHSQVDGSYLVDGVVTLRELNRVTAWKFPTRGPRTLSGLIIEYLEAIPHAGTCLRLSGYPIEIIQMHENRVKIARVFPKS